MSEGKARGRRGPGKLLPLVRALVLVGLAVAALMAPGRANAQDPEPTVLTLRSAIATSLEENAALSEARWGLEAAQAQAREAWGSILPAANLSASYTRNVDIPSSFLPAFIFDENAGPDELVEVQFGSRNNWYAQVRADQPLFNAAAFLGVGAAGRYEALQQEMVRGRAQELNTITTPRRPVPHRVHPHQPVQLGDQARDHHLERDHVDGRRAHRADRLPDAVRRHHDGVGIISLAGVVVNNAIVLIDYIDVLRDRDGLGRREALVQGGKTRFRPVVLTAITTVLGLVPLAIGLNFNFFGLFASLDPDLYWGGEQAAWWGPMAIAVIVGLSFATVLTLILVPVLYSLVDDFGVFFRRHYSREDAPGEPASEPAPAPAPREEERVPAMAREGLRPAEG